MRAVCILLILASNSSFSRAQTPQPKRGNHVVCYYTDWSAHRKAPFNFKPEDLDPFLCTHVIYAFAFFGRDYDFDETQADFKDLQPRLIALKEKNRELKVMCGTGGWREGSTGFGEITKNETTRMKFAQNVVTFLRKKNFDGIDLNWQHPTLRQGGGPQDKENYVHLARILRDQFEDEAMKTNRPRLLLAISITQSKKALPGYDISSFNIYMDFISILSYDYVFSHTDKVKHHSPLYAIPDSPDYEEDKTLNINYTVNYFLDQADAQKLVLGIPTYGRTFNLTDPNMTDLGSEADGAGKAGPYTNEEGFLAYYEICSKINNESWTVVQTKPSGAVGPHAFKDNQWVGYDDVEMVRTKARYARERGLAGVVFWTIDYDDFLGISCGQGPYPLINAAKDELNTDLHHQLVFPTDPILATRKQTTMRPAPSQTDATTRPAPTSPAPTSPETKIYSSNKPHTELPAVTTPQRWPTDAYHPTTTGYNMEVDARNVPTEETDLVEETIQLINRAGGLKRFCLILRKAKTAFRSSGGRLTTPVDGFGDGLRAIITNIQHVQNLNVYTEP